MPLDESTASDLHFLLVAVEKAHGSINFTELAKETGIRNPSSARTRLWRIRKKVDAVPHAYRVMRRQQRAKKEKIPKGKYIDDGYLNEEDEEVAIKQESPPPLENTSGGGGFIGRKGQYANVGNGKNNAIFIKDEFESDAESDINDDEDMMLCEMNTKFRGIARPRPSLASRIKTEPVERDVSLMGGTGFFAGGMSANVAADPDIARLMGGSKNGASTRSGMGGFFSAPEKDGPSKGSKNGGGTGNDGDLVVLDD